MATSPPARVNPPLLTWAREESGYDSETVARRLSVKPERLLAWEHGKLAPTVRQAQKLAKLYHRPFGVFFLPQPPAILPLAAEYRRLPGIRPGRETPELRLALRVMSQRRDVALELSEELGDGFPDFRTAAQLTESPNEVGRRLRLLLGVTQEEQLGWRDEWQAWRRWREAVEAVGILVFQFPSVDLEQARGVSLLRFPLPAIGINTRESAPGARIFTLLHELAHLALACGEQEKAALREMRDEVAWSEVERFSEEAASAALIPEEVLDEFLSDRVIARDQWDVPRVRELARKLRVTPLALATRLRAVGELTWEGYRRWKSAWGEYLRSLQPRQGGFAAPVEKSISRGGRPLVRLVLGALDANRITAVRACQVLDLRFDQFDKLRTELRIGSSYRLRPLLLKLPILI